MTSTLSKITAWFDALTPETLASIDEVYAEQAHFKDPFNDVVGIERIKAIYAHMFENLTNPRFEITRVIEQQVAQQPPHMQQGKQEQQAQQAQQDKQEHEAFVAWQFKFEWRGRMFDIPGGTRFVINDQGLVTDHVDYWDVAELYEKLPFIGALLRPLRKRMAAA